MHDLPQIINALGAFLGGLVIAYNAWGNHKHDAIQEYKAEIKQKQEDAELYRQRWLTAEKANDEKNKQIRELNNQIAILQNELKGGKT